jgi:hypothetical protein
MARVNARVPQTTLTQKGHTKKYQKSGKKASKNFHELDGPNQAINNETIPKMKSVMSDTVKTLFSFNSRHHRMLIGK